MAKVSGYWSDETARHPWAVKLLTTPDEFYRLRPDDLGPAPTQGIVICEPYFSRDSLRQMGRIVEFEWTDARLLHWMRRESH